MYNYDLYRIKKSQIDGAPGTANFIGSVKVSGPATQNALIKYGDKIYLVLNIWFEAGNVHLIVDEVTQMNFTINIHAKNFRTVKNETIETGED